MKKIFLAAFLAGSAFLVCAQMTLSSGSQIVVASGSTLVVNDVVNNNGSVNNAGTVHIKGNLENNTSVLMDPASIGTVVFNGTSAQEITGDADAAFWGTIQISNSSGVSIKTSTGHSQTINGTLDFASGLLTLNEFDLTLSAAATNTGADSYVQTNSTGAVKRIVAATGVIFPVGNTTYNPVTLTNAGTSDTYGVVAKDGLPTSFTSNDHAVNRYWDISEAVGGESNLTVQAQWSTNTTPSNEQVSFARAASCMGYTVDNGTTVTWGSIGAATGGSDDWLCAQTGFTQDLSTASSFFVADDYFKGYNLNLQVWLSGPYSVANHDMDNKLNTAEGGALLIPLIDPFDDGVTTTVGSIHADIVDWVKIELRASDRTASRKVYHAFVNTSGNVVDYNNNPFMASEVDFSLTDYSVAIIHRNHLGIVSDANDINLRTTTGTNFKLLTNAYDDGTVLTNDAMNVLETDVYGMWSGDANGDGEVQYASGANSDQVTLLNSVGSTTPGNIVSNTYSNNDVNMDRDIQYASGSNSDQVSILNVVGSTTPGNIKTEHLPE